MKPSSFIAITSEGGLLPADFLHELPDPKTTIEGVTPVAYHLAEGERLNEQINRSWNRLKGCWENFKKAVAEKTLGDPTTTDTRERWLFPLFQELGFGRLTAAKPIEVDGRSYPVSHDWNQVPIHLVGSHADLDHRTPGAIGASKASPHSLVQSALNASDAHLWGIVSNGFNLRLLRDNIALTRLAYVEFDLQAMFDGDLYSEFFVLWLVCHQSRFEGEKPVQYWLEKWKKSAEDKTLRALDDLYPGVKKAIAALGSGLVSHPGNTALREKLRTGKLTTQEFYRQVLRVIYRMLFQLVAEDRALLHVPDESEAALKARRRYLDFYSIARLRSLTLYRSGTPHPDLWHVFQFVTAKLGSDTGCPELALPPLGSFLWSAAQSTPDLLDSLISNRHFLEAVHAIAFIQDGNVRRAVDYKNLGSEELGSVYQGLLEMHPRINADAGSFELDTAAGNERKTSGSYYTPDSLVQCLLDSALEPVIAERLAKAKTPKEKDAALLNLKVCDMAAGSGHFIIRAGHRIARHLARVRSGEEEPSPRVYQTALRDVIGHCLYGVDINPMAVELCKVTLWLEALEPSKPLSFLDHHIRCGNSLLGTTPELIKDGIPEDAYTAIEGDDKEACAALKKKNKRENPKLGEWFVADEAVLRDKLYQAAAAIDAISDNRPEDIRRKETAFQVAQSNYDFQKAKDLADLWCAAFVIKKYFPATADKTSDLRPPTSDAPATPAEKQSVMFGGADEGQKAKAKKTKALSRPDTDIPIGVTTQHLRDFVAGGALPDGLLTESKRLASQYQFFHFHLAFPEVFAEGGFDVSLGNPPWEKINLKDEEFFASSHPHIAAAASKAVRKNLIERLKEEEPTSYARYVAEKEMHDHTSVFFRFSGCYPLTGVSRINLYSVFCETGLRTLAPRGRLGMVLASGIVTDDNNKNLFASLIEGGLLIHAWDFENSEGIFHGVHRSFKFLLLCAGGVQTKQQQGDFAFYLTDMADLKDPERHFTLSSVDLHLLNPVSGTCPAFRNRAEAELTKHIYRRVKAWAIHEKLADWPGSPKTPFNMSNDSGLFVEKSQMADIVGRTNLPLYESKFIHQFNHRFGTFSGGDGDAIADFGLRELQNPHAQVESRYWLDAAKLAERFPARWFLVWRDITCATNERTSISAIVPNYPCAHTLSLVESVSAISAITLCAALNSQSYDYCARQKVTGTHLNHGIWKQLPLPSLSIFTATCGWSGGIQTLRDWLLPRVLELTYTAWNLEVFAQDCGWSGPPFSWDEERRFLLRCELDAAFFHLYLGPETEWRQQPAALTQAFPTPRAAVAYILDTFPIVKRKDEAKFKGDYRTKRVILEIYDALAAAMKTGNAYQTRLNPPAASLAVAHPWSWDGKPLELPTALRVPLPESWQYVVTVMVELVWQAGGSLPWRVLRSATDLLSDRYRLARLAELHVGQVALDWLALNGDSFDATHRWDQLSGLCHMGKLRVVRRDGELVVELLSTEGHLLFPHVRFDARLALTVARPLPAEPQTHEALQDERRVAELIPA